MRIVIDNVSDGFHVRAAIEALENAGIPHEGGAHVTERDMQYAVILIRAGLAASAITVLRKSGIAARLE
jgi:hypothetical protein